MKNLIRSMQSTEYLICCPGIESSENSKTLPLIKNTLYNSIFVNQLDCNSAFLLSCNVRGAGDLTSNRSVNFRLSHWILQLILPRKFQTPFRGQRAMADPPLAITITSSANVFSFSVSIQVLSIFKSTSRL